MSHVRDGPMGCAPGARGRAPALRPAALVEQGPQRSPYASGASPESVA